jgi:hypothetical protein
MRRVHVWWVILVAVIFMAASSSQTFSQALQDKDIEQRFTNQTTRISEGVKSKQLTQEEGKILQDNLTQIRKEGVRLQGDGKLTAEEKTQLNKMLDQNNHMMKDKKQYPIKAIAAPATVPAPATPVTPTPAAQDPEIKEKIASQQKRIDAGVKSQELTLNESKILQANLSEIQEEDARLRADGTFSKEDKTDLLEILEDNDKMIKNKKNNPVKNITEHRALTDRTRTVPERIARQQRRIETGTKSKTLTPNESTVLLENLDFIKKEEARLRTNNKLTDQERNRLHALLDENSAMIEKKMKKEDTILKKIREEGGGSYEPVD